MMGLIQDGARVATPALRAYDERTWSKGLRIGVIGYGYWGPKLMRNLI